VSIDVRADADAVDEPRRSNARAVWTQLRGDRAAVIGGALIVFFVLVAALAPLLARLEGQDPLTFHIDALDGSGLPTGGFGGMSSAHWFGVEPLNGRDLFAITVYGARTSLLVGVAATAIAITIGVLVGVTSGFLGGWYDTIASRIVDVLFGFPGLIFMIALGSIAPSSFPKPVLIVAVIGFFGWPSIARVVRGQTLTLRQRNFVQASTAMGSSNWHVVRTQVLPNLTATIIVFTTISIPGMIGAEAALSFLGVGVPPPTPSWGRSIGNAVAWVQTDPLYLVFPGLALFAATLGFNAFGDGLRDALDPRSRNLRA
jgi:peptide/nickel transport system permease protein